MSYDTSEILNRIKELDNKLTTTNTNLTSLITAINNLSSKYTTPLNTSIAVTKFSAKFRFYDITESTWTYNATGPTYGLTCSSAAMYVYDATTADVRKFTTSAASFCTPADNPSHCAWDYDNSQLYTIGDTTVETWNSSGTQTATATLSHSSWSAGAWTVKAAAYDDDNDQLYAVLWNSAAVSLVYVKVNPTTGAMTADVSISAQFTGVYDAEIFDELLYLNDTTLGLVLVFNLGDAAPLIVCKTPILPDDCFAADKTYNMWHWYDATPAASSKPKTTIRALAYVGRMSLEDYQSSGRLTYSNATIGGTAASLVGTNLNRESIEIYNNHASNILYVGEDGNVTTSNGRPILPKSSLTINGYTGEIYLIADAAGTDVRYLEVD